MLKTKCILSKKEDDDGLRSSVMSKQCKNIEPGLITIIK